MIRIVASGIGIAVLLACSGCAGMKQHKKASNHAVASTNQFASSVSAQAAQTAPTNTVPAKAPDDTAQNKAEQGGDTLTPMDQGNSDLDRRITQQLRRAVVFGQGKQHFSFAAKNIKIITINAEVTLRGVVRDEAEKQAVQKAAEQIAGVRKVNNQLTVKHASAR